MWCIGCTHFLEKCIIKRPGLVASHRQMEVGARSFACAGMQCKLRYAQDVTTQLHHIRAPSACMLITRRQDPVHDARTFRPQLELENFLREKIHMLGRIVLAHTN